MEYLKKIYGKIKDYGKLVMFSHTIFSFSFAAVALLLASEGRPDASVLFWAVLALLGARTGANAINRAIDAKIDSRNPRTRDRQIPKGEVSIRETVLLSVACFLLLVISARQLNPLCFYLSPIALFCLVFYSYTKRFTWLCHLFLGVTCAMAPVGAYLAVTGAFDLIPLVLGAVNCLWVAGFDIIYGAQDYEFDKNYGLHSIPVAFGIKGALIISTLFHAAALVLLGVFLWLARPVMGILMWCGFFAVACLMTLQHLLVKPGDLKNVEVASYSISQITSLVILVCGVLDIYW